MLCYMKEGIIDILKKSGLSLTDTRKRILQFFLESDNALAHADVERLSGDQFDRVTSVPYASDVRR